MKSFLEVWYQNNVYKQMFKDILIKNTFSICSIVKWFLSKMTDNVIRISFFQTLKSYLDWQRFLGGDLANRNCLIKCTWWAVKSIVNLWTNKFPNSKSAKYFELQMRQVAFLYELLFTFFQDLSLESLFWQQKIDWLTQHFLYNNELIIHRPIR